MSMIDTDQVRSALRSAASAAGEAETFFDILIPVDDGRSDNPLMIGQLFGVDLIQHPDVPEGQMYIKKKPVENYKPQGMIADLQDARRLLVELKDDEGRWSADEVIVDRMIELLDVEILQWQKQIQMGPES